MNMIKASFDRALASEKSFLPLMSKASINADFMVRFSIHSYFGNRTEEFHPHETLSTPMKL